MAKNDVSTGASRKTASDAKRAAEFIRNAVEVDDFLGMTGNPDAITTAMGEALRLVETNGTDPGDTGRGQADGDSTDSGRLAALATAFDAVAGKSRQAALFELPSGNEPGRYGRLVAFADGEPSPAIPESLDGCPEAASVLERWERERSKAKTDHDEAMALYRAIRTLALLEDLADLADECGGASGIWGRPVYGWADDPFQGMLPALVDVIGGSRNDVDGDIAGRVMERTCPGSWANISGAVKAIESDYEVARRWAHGDPSRRPVADALTRDGRPIGTVRRYEALRAAAREDEGRAMLDELEASREKLAKTSEWSLDTQGRLFMGGSTVEQFLNTLLNLARNGDSSATVSVDVDVALPHSKERVRKTNELRIIVPRDFGPRLRSVAQRVRVVDLLGVLTVFQQAWEDGYKQSDGSDYVRILNEYLVELLMATGVERPVELGKDGKPKRREGIRKHRAKLRFVEEMVSVLSEVVTDIKVWDQKTAMYRQIRAPLIGIAASEGSLSDDGTEWVDTWIARKDPVILFSHKAIGRPNMLPLPGVEPFSEAEWRLWYLMMLKVHRLDWKADNRKGVDRNGLCHVTVGRTELENGGGVDALEGNRRKAQPGGGRVDRAVRGAIKVTDATIRTRKYRELQEVAGCLDKVTAAIYDARAARGLPGIDIRPEYVKTEKGRMLSGITIWEKARPKDPGNGPKRKAGYLRSK